MVPNRAKISTPFTFASSLCRNQPTDFFKTTTLVLNGWMAFNFPWNPPRSFPLKNKIYRNLPFPFVWSRACVLQRWWRHLIAHRFEDNHFHQWCQHHKSRNNPIYKKFKFLETYLSRFINQKIWDSSRELRNTLRLRVILVGILSYRNCELL